MRCWAQGFGWFVEVEVVAAADVEVLGHGWPEVDDVVVADVEPRGAESVDGLAEEFGVVRGDAVDDQGEAQGLGGLVSELAVADVTVMSEVHGVAQPLERLALVELASDPAAELGPLQVADDEQGLDQPAVLLEGDGEGVLAGEGLELGQQQRRRHRPFVDGGAEA